MKGKFREVQTHDQTPWIIYANPVEVGMGDYRVTIRNPRYKVPFTIRIQIDEYLELIDEVVFSCINTSWYSNGYEKPVIWDSTNAKT